MLHIAGLDTAERPRRDRKEALPAGPLGKLVRAVVRTCGEPTARMMGERIVSALQAAAGDPALVAPEQCRPHAECYARHVLYADPAGRFTVLALVWGAGQFSPSHAHHTWCAYAVRSGVLNETLYAYDDATGLVRPSRMATRTAGYACFAEGGLDQIHRLGNAGGEPAISIHVYGVAQDRIATHVNRIVEVAPPEG